MSLYLVMVLLVPQVVLATPLTGADSDVLYLYKGMIGYEDDTTDANDADSSGDVHWVETSTKISIIGHATTKFTKVVVDVSSATLNPGENLMIRYWNGSAWAILTLDAETHPFDTTGVNSFTFSAPVDWAQKIVNEVNGYWVATGDPDNFGGELSALGSSGAGVSQISVLLAAGGGEAVPEFTDIMYFTTLLAGGAYLYKRNSQIQKTTV